MTAGPEARGTLAGLDNENELSYSEQSVIWHMHSAFTRESKFLLLGLCPLRGATALRLRDKRSPAASAILAGQGTPEAAVSASAIEIQEPWWKTLRRFCYRQRTADRELQAFHAVREKIPGAMVPLEDEAGRVREVRLVPDGGTGIHTPPPQPSRSVLVRTVQQKAAGPKWHQPIRVEGVCRITRAGSIHGGAACTLVGQSIESYREEAYR